jgi:hypothetical protein
MSKLLSYLNNHKPTNLFALSQGENNYERHAILWVLDMNASVM